MDNKPRKNAFQTYQKHQCFVHPAARSHSRVIEGLSDLRIAFQWYEHPATYIFRKCLDLVFSLNHFGFSLGFELQISACCPSWLKRWVAALAPNCPRRQKLSPWAGFSAQCLWFLRKSNTEKKTSIKTLKSSTQAWPDMLRARRSQPRRAATRAPRIENGWLRKWWTRRGAETSSWITMGGSKKNPTIDE